MAGLRASDGIWEKGGSSPPCEVLSPGKGEDSELPVVTRCDMISEPGLVCLDAEPKKPLPSTHIQNWLCLPLFPAAVLGRRDLSKFLQKKKLNSRLSSVGLRNHYINIKHQDARVYIT